MARLTPEIKAFLEEQLRPAQRMKFCLYLATVDEQGVPNVVPVGSGQVLDEQTILLADNFMGKTRHNLERNPRAALAVADEGALEGYQLKGHAELVGSGPLLERVRQHMEEACRRFGISPPIVPRAAVVFRVEEVYALRPGPEAGKRVL